MSVHNRLPSSNRRKLRNPKINRLSPFGAVTKCAFPLSDAIGIQGNPTTGKIYDVSGFGYHGETTSLTLTHTPFGWGVDFGPGDTEKILIWGRGGNGDTLPLLSKDGQLAWFFLIKFSVVNESQTIMDTRAVGKSNEGFTFSIRSDGKLQVVTNDPTHGDTTVGNTALSADTWYRVGFSFGTANGATQDLAIYVNGFEDAFSTTGGPADSTADSAVIGKIAAAVSTGLTDAVIADMVYYDRFISEKEAEYEYGTLFDEIYEVFPMATDFNEPIGGGVVAGGEASVGGTIQVVIEGGAIAGGKAPEEPPVSGGVLGGGHSAEETFFTASGGVRAGGEAFNEGIFDSQGGGVAGGIATVSAIYFPTTVGATNTTPETFPTASSQSGVYNEWFNLSFVTVKYDKDTDSAYSNLEDSSTARTRELYVTGFNLAVPSNVTIQGIEVIINAETSNAGRGEYERVFLTKDGSTKAGNEKSSTTELGTTPSDRTFGAYNDLWGTTWSPADLNSSNFGFAIRFISGNGSGTTRIDVYNMRVKVTGVDINTNNVVNLSGEGQSPNTYNETVSGGALAGGEGLESEGQAEPVSGGAKAGGIATELMAFDPLTSGGAKAGGEGIEAISSQVSGGIIVGGHTPEIFDILGEGGILLSGVVEISQTTVDGGAVVGGEGSWSITPFIEGGAKAGGATGLLFEKGGALIGGAATELATYTGNISGGTAVGGIANVTSSEEFIPTGGVKGGGEAAFVFNYNIAVAGGVDVGGEGIEEISPSIGGGVDAGGEANSFVDPQIPKGGILVGGKALIAEGIVGAGGTIVGGIADESEEQTEPVAGGVFVGVIDPGAAWSISVYVDGGARLGGETTETVNIVEFPDSGVVLGGKALIGIDQSIGGGTIAGGEAFEFITEIGIGGAVLGGRGFQTFFETTEGGTVVSGEASSSIDYTGQNGGIIGGTATVNAEYIKFPEGGTVVDGSAQRSTRINEYTFGGAICAPKFLFNYEYVGGIRIDDTVPWNGIINIGGTASVIRPTIKFIGNGPVVVSGEAEASFAFSDFSFESQIPVSTPVVIQGTADVTFVVFDQVCTPPDKPCYIDDFQTQTRRTHCTTPQLIASYCGDLRRQKLCSTDEALLPAIISCRQRLLRQQEVLDIKNKTVLRNRGRVI